MAGLEDRIFRLIPREVGALKLLRTYLAALTDPEGIDVPPAVSRTVSNHVTDLIALTLGATGDAGATPRLGGGMRAARLAAAKAYIEDKIGPSNLSIDDVADHMGVSARYVRKLFEADGETFSKYVLEQRLIRVRNMLTNARFDHRPISSIAYDVGFGDLSYFNKVFRAASSAALPSDREPAAARVSQLQLAETAR